MDYLEYFNDVEKMKEQERTECTDTRSVAVCVVLKNKELGERRSTVVPTYVCRAWEKIVTNHTSWVKSNKVDVDDVFIEVSFGDHTVVIPVCIHKLYEYELHQYIVKYAIEHLDTAVCKDFTLFKEMCSLILITGHYYAVEQSEEYDLIMFRKKLEQYNYTGKDEHFNLFLSIRECLYTSFMKDFLYNFKLLYMYKVSGNKQSEVNGPEVWRKISKDLSKLEAFNVDMSELRVVVEDVVELEGGFRITYRTDNDSIDIIVEGKNIPKAGEALPLYELYSKMNVVSLCGKGWLHVASMLDQKDVEKISVNKISSF